MYLFEVDFSSVGVGRETAKQLAEDLGVEPFEFAKDAEGKELELLSWNTRSVSVTTAQLSRWTGRVRGGLRVTRVIHIKDDSQFDVPSGYTGERRSGPAYNAKVNVAVGGQHLMQVDEVKAEIDLCSSRLNEMLGEGWRIIAVCVQPDQRRPDYVLGRVAVE